MNLLAIVLCAVGAANISTVSGYVVDDEGHSLSGAHVFLEQGLSGPLIQTRSGVDGAYHFEDVLPGIVGVFAYQEGHALGGQSFTLAVGQHTEDIELRLGKPGTLAGKITDPRGKAVASARITRLALIGDTKVGIPLTKLQAYGWPVPTSDSSGKFRLSSLPEGAKVALKIAHPKFAQEGVMDLRVGKSDINISLQLGVLITGEVRASGTELGVANAAVLLRNAAPPFDTAVTRTGMQGDFGLRLKPGTYLYQVQGTTLRSPGWRTVSVSGELPVKQLELYVAGTGTLRGKVMDAKSGDPVENARLVLEIEGKPTAVVRTGPSGTYELAASVGENLVRLDAVPGFLPPPSPAIRVTVQADETTELPGFWLMPIPIYTLMVVDTDATPVKDAFVHLLRPTQFGWYTTDAEGKVDLRLAALPPDGKVYGMVEHPSRPEGALFAITRENAHDAVVELMPLSRVVGKVQSTDKEPIPGAVVSGRYIDESFDEPIVLWRTVTEANGIFEWPTVAPQAPHVVVAHATNETTGEIFQSDYGAFIIPPATEETLKPLELSKATSGRSLLGTKLKWAVLDPLCGTTPPRSAKSNPAIVVYCSPAEATMVIESLEAATALLRGRNITMVAVINGDTECASSKVLIFHGEAPGSASTYITDKSGKVTLETFGMPPLQAINRVAPLHDE